MRVFSSGTLFALSALIISSGALSIECAAQESYPDRPVKIISGFPPGGGSDTVARIVAQKLSEKWGQPVIIENKPGADGTIGAEIVARAPHDGYTLLWMTSNHTSTPSLRKLPFDPVKDFSPISIVVTGPQLLTASLDFAPNSLSELIALAKLKPGAINFATTGMGGPPFLIMAGLMKATGTRMTNIPFKGTGEAVTALMSGEVQIMLQNPLSSQGAVKERLVKAIAITGSTRSSALPDVPTFRESEDISGLDDLVTWYGLSSPANTPNEIIDKIYNDTVEVLHKPEVEKLFIEGGLNLVTMSPEESQKRIDKSIVMIRDLLKDVGTTP